MSSPSGGPAPPFRSEARFLIFAGAFGLFVALAYWFVSYEEAGSVLLGLMGTASAFVGGYLVSQRRKVRLRAEDDPDATHVSAAGETVGEFSSGSIWPLLMAIGATIGLQGFVFGRWLLFAGGIFFVWAIVGLMMESRG